MLNQPLRRARLRLIHIKFNATITYGKQPIENSTLEVRITEIICSTVRLTRDSLLQRLMIMPNDSLPQNKQSSYVRQSGCYRNLPGDCDGSELTAIVAGATEISGFNLIRSLLDEPNRWAKIPCHEFLQARS